MTEDNMFEEPIDVRRQELISRETAKSGMRGKVNAKCIECIYDPRFVGNWRKQVQGCTSKSCPLYEIRPVSSVG